MVYVLRDECFVKDDIICSYTYQKDKKLSESATWIETVQRYTKKGIGSRIGNGRGDHTDIGSTSPPDERNVCEDLFYFICWELIPSSIQNST